MNFRLNIDDSSISVSSTTVGLTTVAVSSIDYSVTLQYGASSLLPGSHEVTVETMRECRGQIYDCYLLVQTYIP